MDTSQSNVIFAYLLIAFIVFITVKGELPTYLGFLLGGSSVSPTGQNDAGGVASAASIAGSVGNSTPTQLNLTQPTNDANKNLSSLLDFASLFA